MTPLRKTIPFDVRVMTFNIRCDNPSDGEDRWENRKVFVCDVIRDDAPDVLGVQEANRHQLDVLRTNLPEYSEIGIGRDGDRHGEYSAILYQTARFDLAASGTVWLSETPTKPSRDWESACRRICTWAQLTDKESKQSFLVYNTHLDHISQLARMKGVQLIMEQMDRRDSGQPAIMMGDFNVEEDNPVITFLKRSESPETPGGLLVDTFRALHPGETTIGTCHDVKGHADGNRIDYIFVTPEFSTLEATIVRTSRDGRYPSDDCPVTANLQFKQNADPGKEIK